MVESVNSLLDLKEYTPKKVETFKSLDSMIAKAFMETFNVPDERGERLGTYREQRDWQPYSKRSYNVIKNKGYNPSYKQGEYEYEVPDESDILKMLKSIPKEKKMKK